MLKFMKYFYFSCNSFFGTFILAFPFLSNAVLLFRENKHSELALLSLLFMIEIPTFALHFSKFLALLYCYLFRWMALESLFAYKSLPNLFD